MLIPARRPRGASDRVRGWVRASPREHNPQPVTGHLRPTSTIAPDLLLPGDPEMALVLAQSLLEKPLMANHSHGLWGYSGRVAGGRELTIQSTGIGGPSTATVITELVGHGARRAIRIGRAVALDPGLAVGDCAVVTQALGEDGVSRALGTTAPTADSPLSEALARAAGPGVATVSVASSDLFHDPAAELRRTAWRKAGAALTDLETAAAFAVARQLEIRVACALVVAETAGGLRDDEAADRSLLALGPVCAEALAASAAPGGGSGIRVGNRELIG